MKSNIKLLSEPSALRQLAKMLPLEAPFSILIDPCNLCNFKCCFCPTGQPSLLKKVARPNGLMDFNLFCKIIDDIQCFGEKIEKINLYKDGEPFLNKNFIKMIAYAKAKGIAKNISTTSNGLLINEAKAKEIIDAGLDSIRISVEHVSDAGYKKITRTPTQYESIRKNVEFLFKNKEKRKSLFKIHVKIIDTGLTNFEKDKFIKDFADISDSINIDQIDGRNNNHGYDFTLGQDQARQKNRQVCPDPFFTLAVNFNGLVSVCCADWSLDTIVGDANKESLPDIWRGEKLRQFRILHLKGERKKINICSNCQVFQGAPIESDLDAAAVSLLSAYEQ